MTASVSSKKLSPAEIVDVHRQGVIRKPLDAEAWALLSATYATAGEWPQALHARRRAVELSAQGLGPADQPSAVQSFANLAQLYFELGMHDDGLDMLTHAADLDDGRDLMLLAAQALVRLGHTAKAVERLQIAAIRYPEAPILASLGCFLLKEQRPREALEAFAKACEADTPWMLAEENDDILEAYLDAVEDVYFSNANMAPEAAARSPCEQQVLSIFSFLA